MFWSKNISRDLSLRCIWCWYPIWLQPPASWPTVGAPTSKVHGTNMGPTWVMVTPGGPHVGPMNLDIWGALSDMNMFQRDTQMKCNILQIKNLEPNCRSQQPTYINECLGSEIHLWLGGYGADSMRCGLYGPAFETQWGCWFRNVT